MSRSYKKHPWYTDGSPHSTKESKKLANKKVRRTDDVPLKGKGYKKIYETYDIHDFKTRYSKQEWIRDYKRIRYRKYESFEDYINYWEKTYRRK